MVTTFIGIVSFVMASQADQAYDPDPPALEPVPAAYASPPSAEPRTALRANAMVQAFDFAGLGVEASHSFDELFAIEGSLDSVDLNRGLTGSYAQLSARLGSFGWRHAFSLGAGPGLLHSRDFGSVAFLVPELAYEYRPAGGVSVAVGLSAAVTLNDSVEVPCMDTGFLGCFLERTQFHQGEVEPRMRVALGYSF
jgi:hypothetical protein